MTTRIISTAAQTEVGIQAYITESPGLYFQGYVKAPNHHPLYVGFIVASDGQAALERLEAKVVLFADDIFTDLLFSSPNKPCHTDPTSDPEIGIDIETIEYPTATAPAPTALPIPRKTKRTKKRSCICPGCIQVVEAHGMFDCTVEKGYFGFDGGQFICAGDARTVETALLNYRYETLRRAA